MNLLNMFKDTRNIVVAAVTAALYVALTLMLAPIGYGMVQFRISEVLCLLSFFSPVYGVGVTVGCFLANLASPYGILDMIIGTLCTLCSVFFISKTKNLFIASLWPTIFSLPLGVLISYMTNVNFFVTSFSLMLSEFIVVTLIGYPLFTILCKNTVISGFLRHNLITIK